MGQWDMKYFIGEASMWRDHDTDVEVELFQAKACGFLRSRYINYKGQHTTL